MSDWNNFFSSGIFSARARTYWIYKAIQAYDLANRATLNYFDMQITELESNRNKFHFDGKMIFAIWCIELQLICFFLVWRNILLIITKHTIIL